MKVILEIQKIDRQIKALEREVEKCPANMDFQRYKQTMQEGRIRFEQLENQANDIIKSYNLALSRLPKHQGNSDIIKKSKVENISLENVQNLISDANNMVGDLSEEGRKLEDLVRKAEEVVRKCGDLSNKLTEAKTRANSIKNKIETKKQEVAPKIALLEEKVKELEPKITNKDKYDKYKTMKQNGIFPVYVPLEDVFCGGCKVELSLEFVERLKTNKMMTCEHCGRTIMSEVK